MGLCQDADGGVLRVLPYRRAAARALDFHLRSALAARGVAVR